jgi:hypothetical protein
VRPGDFAHPLELVIRQVERVPSKVVLTVAPEVVSNGATLVLWWHMPESHVGIDGVLPRLGE